jgi:apolipoprotein N-acyltransferase
MIRAANTGITCAIDRNGVVREILRDTNGSTFEPGILFSKISAPQNPAPTFYTRFGEVFSIACLLVSALAAGLAAFRLVQKPSPRPNPADPPNSTP